MSLTPLTGLMATAAVALVVAAPARTEAQETIHYASLSGRVIDTSGGTVAGARITARQTETNVVTAAVSDGDGRFRFAYLRVGPYEIAVAKTGFATVARALVLGAGAAVDLPVTVAVGGVETSVSVSADSPVLEAARSQIAGTIAQTEIQSVPINGRNFLDLALLVPGVSPTNVGGGTQLFAETSAVLGVGLSVGSQRNFSNNFIVDGLSANDDAAGLSGILYGVDAVDQFQVVTSGGQAELGRALGGFISIVTKSGTNRLRGDVYHYQRHRRLNSPNALTSTRLPMNQAQFGGSLGGALARDRTFFFVNAEQRRLDQSGVTTILGENASAINARLAAVGYLGPLVATGVFPNPVDTVHATGKVDHHLGNAAHLSVRYSLYDVRSRNSRGAGGLNAPSASAGLDNTDQTVAVGNVFALSPRTVLETRGQVAYGDLHALPSDQVGPAVAITGVASFGTLSGSPTGRANTMYQIVNNLSHQAGAHAVRVGLDVLHNDVTITFPRSLKGVYTFSTLANFLTGTYSATGFTQTFGATVVSQTNPNLGLYVQDEWKVGAGVTLNAGLRYDLQWLETIHTDTNNISPRLGFAWSPFASRSTVIRGGAGVFYDRVPLRALANALLSAGNTTDLAQLRQTGVTLAPTQAGAPVFPAILAAVVPTVTLVNFTTMDRNLQNANSRQASVEVEHQLGTRATVSVAYEFLRSRQLVMQVNQNVPTCAASGNNNGCRPNPNFANNSQYSSVGASEYDGLHVSLVQRPVRWGSVRVSYVYSKSMNNVGEAFFNGPIDPFDLSKDWARSDDDQRHRLVVSASVSTSTAPATTLRERLTHGFHVSGMVQDDSALPFNITSGVTTVQGTAGRPIVNGAFISRNAGVGSPFSTTSVRISRTLRFGGRAQIEALVEAFNLFDQRNDVARNGSFGAGAYPASPSSSFGQITAVGDPRSIQMGVRVTF